MNSSVTRLVETLGASESSAPKAWGPVEADLGTSLPDDYKELIDRMGGGRIEEYMYILEPDCPNGHYELVHHAREREESYEVLWMIEDKPPELEVEGSGIIPWATTDNGEFLFWRTLPGQRPDQWTVILNEARGDRWEHYEMNCTDFLLATLTGEVRSRILWSAFPLEQHVFVKFSTES
ncbi:SMI1/KNR4 family protein [Streptomyces sp. NPDC093589]|uniref:SMI1/KNR4 family protein n=1 Tax=Streptomyces sp. NPDC093589 TaxID=3366043 RepID=UPI00380ACA73